MKVEQLTTFTLQAEVDQPFYFSQPGLVHHRSSVVVELVTDEGLSGFGEALCHGHQPPEIAEATVESCLRPLVIGADPFDAGVVFEQMYNRTKDFGQKGAVISAISAVDIAMWDLMGKATGKPVHKLLGGAFRQQVQPYATGFYRVHGDVHQTALVEEAVSYAEAGFSAMKIKIGFGVAEDVKMVRAVRAAVGPDIRLLADANHAYNAALARRLVRELDEIDVFWLEEPISPEDIDGYRCLRGMGPSLLLAAGENEYTRHGFWSWARTGAVDVLQPDIAAGGGFTGLRQVMDLALAAGLILNPHVWGTAIGLAASLQLLAAIPTAPISRAGFEPMLEYDQSEHPFRGELTTPLPRIEDGAVLIPDGPGLGIEVDRSALERFCKRR